MKSIESVSDLYKKKILLRLDLNVPIKNGHIIDTTRIDKILPTINFLLKKNAKIIILSHVGRPKGKNVNELSLRPVSEDIKKKINTDVKLITKNIREISSEDLFIKPEEKILMFENIRFYKEEEQNDNDFAKNISKLADIYVNDAFSCSHRAHSSIHELPKFLPSYSGLQLNSELYALKRLTSEIKKPITCIIGGSKISTKINIILNLIKNVDNVIIVGAMANSFLYNKGYNIGKSLFEENTSKIIEKIYSESKKNNCRIVLPIDCQISKNFEGKAQVRAKDKVNNDEIILDIGPKTIELITKIIHESKTVLWNGPAGYYENENFSIGTKAIANKISENTCNNSLISILGGGDTIAALNKSNLKLSFTHLSTAGGAFLEYLEGKDLPGLTVLK